LRNPAKRVAPSRAKRATLRLLAGLVAAGVTARASGASASNAVDSEGRAPASTRYRLISQQPLPAGNVIDVVEFFWYGCPYCFQLEPYFQAWLRRQSADVAVRRIPAVFRDSWIPHARLYYTLEALDAVERLHQQVYESYHVEQTPLNSIDEIADWAQRHGIDRERWLAVYRSDEISGRIMQARDQLRSYEVSGTPSVVIDGRYLTSSGMTPGVPAMIPVLENLVALVREQRGTR
jgi:protein dithiol oxidoreductase (disulfide-forming)